MNKSNITINSDKRVRIPNSTRNSIEPCAVKVARTVLGGGKLRNNLPIPIGSTSLGRKQA